MLAERHADRALVVADALFTGVASIPASVGVLAVVVTPRHVLSTGADFCLLLPAGGTTQTVRLALDAK